MKCKSLVGFLLLGALALRAGAASSFYVNDGVVICPPEIPPQVDATNFVNNNYFSINFTNFFLPQLYTTASTRNFTNNGTMIANGGFRFDTAPPGSGTHSMASSFVNKGAILCGSADNTNTFANFFIFGRTLLFSEILPKLIVSATNVSLRSSTNTVGVDGNFIVTGKNVDLNRARITVEGFEDTATNAFGFNIFGSQIVPGLSAGYWGVGTNTMNPVANFTATTPQTPFHLVTQADGFFSFRRLFLTNSSFYAEELVIGTNRFVQGVFVANTNASIVVNVHFPFLNVPVVEWIGHHTNQVSGRVTTNQMFLTDYFGTFSTNLLITNFSYYSSIGSQIPFNYEFTRTDPFAFFGGSGPAAPTVSPIGVFDSLFVTNEYQAFGAIFSPTTVALDSLPPAGRYLTNLPGRIEITADGTMDLSQARITGLNYMRLQSTNHVSSTSGTKISVPFSDINLGTTNGQLSLTNLLYPVVQRFTGEVDLWSGRWTNVGGGFQTTYSVLFVDSKLDAVAPSRIQDLTLRSTNVIVSDILNVTRNLLADVQRLTITTNQPPAATARGELNLLSSAITWSTSMPRLQYLTNDGAINALNALFLGGSRGSPFYSSNYNEPYLALVNRGIVSSEGSQIWANYFQNSGTFYTRSSFGSVGLVATDARMTNGTFAATNGGVTIASATLSISNSLLYAGRGLTLSVTNWVNDGGTNANTWYTRGVGGDGFSAPVKPATGDLLGTTVFAGAPAEAETVSVWAGEDRGCSTPGFTNNLAVGRLILDGGDGSQFTFRGAGANNAIYIDYLELRNFTTNRDAGGNFVGIQIDPGMKIYFAQAVANGFSIAEKLDKQNGGRFCWVSDYAGFYSSTNVIYPDGTTNLFNAALVGSCNLDSDGDGLVNCSDTTPILRPQDLALSVSLVSAPAPKAQVSWQSGPYAANTVYYSTNANGNWKVLTNFVSGAVGGRVSISDAVSPGGPRYYRVRVDSHQP